MTNNNGNQKAFRFILIAFALFCIFLIGSIIKINFAALLSMTLATALLIIMGAFVIGLILGYALGAGKNFKFWKSNKK